MTYKKITVFDTITGQYTEITVTQTVYDEYRRGKWRIDKNNAKHNANETPISSLIDGKRERCKYRELHDTSSTPEKMAIKNEKINHLGRALDLLDE